MRTNLRSLLAILALLAMVATACSTDEGSDTASDEPAADEEAMDEEAMDEEAPAGGDASGTLVGAGASSQQAAMQGWAAGFQTANPDVTVNYDPVGSGGGRETFLSGGSTFAGSDAFLDDDELAMAEERCAGTGGAVNLPHYISPVAVAFNLPGIDSLNLSPDAIGGIFAGTITNWTDEAIAADNPDADLPDLTINPVHRSDDSGTTENFTGYLDVVAPDSWTFGEIETWPTEAGGEGAQGTSGVVSAVQAGEGSVGYADASQVGELGTAAVGVGEEFVEFSPEAAARVVDVSPRVEGRPDGDFAVELARDTTESGAYPIVLISYHIVCREYESADEAALVTAFMEYVGSEEGQAASAESAGSAPISAELSSEIGEVLSTITGG